MSRSGAMWLRWCADRLCAAGFELGEDLLDRVEIGRIAGQEEQLGAGGADQMADSLALMTAEIVHDHDVAAAQGRHEELLYVSAKAGAVDRAVDDAGRRDPVTAQRRQKEPAPAKAGVRVRQRPCGTLAVRRVPRAHRPWRRVMLVLAHVSSIKTSRLASSRPWYFCHRSRRRAMSARSCSLACRLFFERDAVAGEKR